VVSLVGQQFGEYLLESELGRGSMGVVYRATHRTDGTTHAVKVLLDALTTDTSFVTRFTREATVVAALDHPNIVRVYDAGQQGEYLYFVMEYCPGVTAGRLVKERGRLPVPLVIEIALQAADALAYAHVEGHLVHRDIKPDNLLVDQWSRIKVLDFGLARIEGLHSITSAGTVVGSLYYVSPEQLRGRKLDGRSDVYSLGVSMYEMLSAQRPFRGQTFTELSANILSGACAPLGQLEPTVPVEVERVVARAMARDLDVRYNSAAELWHDLRALQATFASRPAAAPNASSAEGSWTPASTSPPQFKAPLSRPPTPHPRRTLRPTTLQPAPPESFE
jgi:eukaryotic-like serine/threonine-protein kinase